MEMFRKTWLTPLRSRAWSTAAATAAPCTVRERLGDRETSWMVLVPGGGDSAATSTSSPRRSCSTTRGSRSSAMSRTLLFSPVRSLRDLAAEPHQQEDRDHDGDQPDAAGEDGLGDQPVALRRAHRRQLAALSSSGSSAWRPGTRQRGRLPGGRHSPGRVLPELARIWLFHGLELPVGRRVHELTYAASQARASAGRGPRS